MIVCLLWMWSFDMKYKGKNEKNKKEGCKEHILRIH